MLGIEHRIPKRRAFRDLAPQNPSFSRSWIDALPHAAAFASLRTGTSARDGLSLAHNGLRYRGFHSRVNVPGLPLRVLARHFRCPFGLPAPLPTPVCPGDWPLQRLKARCRFRDRLARTALTSFHSPSGFLHPSGSKRSADLAARWSTFRLRPISVRSPQPAAISLDSGYGSPFPVRDV